jgi:multimeric flavodoxin WrbA
MTASVLVLNAGLGGASGNSQAVSEACVTWLTSAGVPHELHVLKDAPVAGAREAIARASALVIVTGTYWGSCSSDLQRLLEELTPSEGSELWLGKPAAVLVTAHQVGAQSVLWRLQGVLSCLGCLIPPMSGVVITRVGELLRQHAPEACLDVWGLEDVGVALSNLTHCLRFGRSFQAWPVDREDYAKRWL